MAKREFETLTPQMFYILLALIEPRHGYDIMNEVTKMTDGELKVGAGTLYTLLPRLEKEVYIELVKEENKRKVYQITNLGKKKLLSEKKRMEKQLQLLEEKL